MQRLVGTVVGDRYELSSVIGSGGQGVVFRAIDRTSGKGVAVKMLNDRDGRDPTLAARFAREQEALVTLAGSSAVAVYDLCRAPDGALCLVMELLDGFNLEDRLGPLEARGERLPLADLSSILAPIVDTLERAHDAGIVHRDVKPANIFILSDGSGVRLVDFGFSRARSAARLTLAGTILGSPSYIAPEAWKGTSDELDRRVDVYSLGVVLFRGLSGRLPFESQTLLGAFTQATTSRRPSLHALRPDLGAEMDVWVSRALAIDREERYGSVRDLWAGFLGALQYTPPPRTFRPVQESLVAAWRAATTAFRRFIDVSLGPIPAPSAPAPTKKLPPPMPVPAALSESAAVDAGWEEIAEDEIVVVTAATPFETESEAIDEAWEEVTDDEVNRPSLYASAPRAPTERPVEHHKGPAPRPSATAHAKKRASKRTREHVRSKAAGAARAKAVATSAAPKPRARKAAAPKTPAPNTKSRKSTAPKTKSRRATPPKAPARKAASQKTKSRKAATPKAAVSKAPSRKAATPKASSRKAARPRAPSRQAATKKARRKP